MLITKGNIGRRNPQGDTWPWIFVLFLVGLKFVIQCYKNNYEFKSITFQSWKSSSSSLLKKKKKKKNYPHDWPKTGDLTPPPPNGAKCQIFKFRGQKKKIINVKPPPPPPPPLEKILRTRPIQLYTRRWPVLIAKKKKKNVGLMYMPHVCVDPYSSFCVQCLLPN